MEAKRTPDVTDEMWNLVNKANRSATTDFLDSQIHLSAKTQYSYTSGLRIFFWWVHEELEDKAFYEIKKKDFIKYLNWLTKRGMSTAAIKFKKSCVSSFCNYIENTYEEEYPNFRSFVTSEMKVVCTGNVHDKNPLTPEEYESLCGKLEDLGEWQKLAWVKFSYSSGCRREESRQLVKGYEKISKEITIQDENGNPIDVTVNSYKTGAIRCKGRSVIGKQRRLQFSQDAADAIEKWLQIRGDDDCPYIFVTHHKDGYQQVSETTFNDWCSGLLTDLVGRRVHPHLFRESRATNLVEYENKSLETAQKLLGHVSSETTNKYYVVRENVEDADEAFV